MTSRSFTSIGEAARAIVEDGLKREGRVRRARRRAARETLSVVQKNVPKAFGELQDSLHVDSDDASDDVIADAPHAAAVENGSMPHMPPLEPILAWVKLRGLQGLTRSGRVITNRTQSGRITDWRREPARYVAAQLANRVRDNGSTPVDAAEQLARAIQHKIAIAGTKPFHYMGESVQSARDFLERFVLQALPDSD